MNVQCGSLEGIRSANIKVDQSGIFGVVSRLVGCLCALLREVNLGQLPQRLTPVRVSLDLFISDRKDPHKKQLKGCIGLFI